MIPEPDPQRLDYQPTPPAARPRVGTIVSWVLILAAVAYLLSGRSPFRESAARATPAGRAGPRPPSFQFRLAGRYAVGAHQLTASLGRPRKGTATAPATGPATGPATTQSTAATQPSPAEGLLEQVDQIAAASGGPDDLIRAAAVAGEVAGADAALSRLERARPGTRLAGVGTEHSADDAEALQTVYTSGPDSLTAAQREGLVRRHEWFGELALAYGRPGDDPGRRQVIQPAMRTVLATGLAVVLGLLALGTGLILLIVAVVKWAGGGLAPAYRPPAPQQYTAPFLEGFAGYLAGMVALSTLLTLMFGRSAAASWFLAAVIPFAFFWPLLRGVGRAEWRHGLGWHAGRGVAREVGAGIAAYLAGLPVLAAGAVVTMMLQRLSGADTSHPLMEEIGRGGAWRSARLFVLAAVWAPVVEETLFRGAFYHHLRRKLPWPAAAALVALVFAAVHPQGWAAIPVLGAIGFCFAAAREWRGSVIAPAVAHALNNGVVTLLLVMMVG